MPNLQSFHLILRFFQNAVLKKELESMVISSADNQERWSCLQGEHDRFKAELKDCKEYLDIKESELADLKLLLAAQESCPGTFSHFYDNTYGKSLTIAIIDILL